MAESGMTVRDLVMENIGVRSQKFSVTKIDEQGVKQHLAETAIQSRLQVGSPRQVYKKVKSYVSALRSPK